MEITKEVLNEIIDSFDRELTKCTGFFPSDLKIVFKQNGRFICAFRTLKEMKDTVKSIRESGKVIEANECYIDNNCYVFEIEQRR